MKRLAIIITLYVTISLSLTALYKRELFGETGANHDSDRQKILRIAAEFVDTPYSYGGTDGSGFDCSGFVQYVYGKVGYKIPRMTRDQYLLLKRVEKPEVGDLIFFNTEGEGASHVGIFTGEGKFIHSPSSGKKIRYSRLENSYWKERYLGARNVFKSRNVKR